VSDAAAANPTATAPPPALAVVDLAAGYDRDLDILRGVTLRADAHELVCLLGPNGAGKSTLLKAVFGLVRVSRGSIVVEGRELAGARPHAMARSGVGYVPQLANVFARLTVEENLAVGSAARRDADGNWLRTRLEATYASFPRLAERRRQDAGSLSGGERQLLALARALIPEPSILLLDEPSAALSPIAVRDVFDHIRQVNAAGVTILMVEQNARLALEVADRAYVLESGQNRYEGVPAELLADDRVVASYLGGLHAPRDGP
jgi:ABC-type branched-subunit amino acid transport system ATPase component